MSITAQPRAHRGKWREGAEVQLRSRRERRAGACGCSTEHGDEARILAGGQSLMPTLNMRLSQPRLLIDINRLDALKGISLQGDRVRIGALTRHVEVANSPVVARAPALDRRGHAARRPRRRAQPRHLRRQHRARRPGGRDAGLRAGTRARRWSCRARPAGARSRPRTTSKASTRRRAGPTSC